MTRIAMVVGALALTSVLGFGAGWLVFGAEPDDRELACTAARSLPVEAGDRWSAATANQVAGVGLLAQAAGSTGDGLNDLDELGRAGRDLQQILQTLRTDEYDDARKDLLAAC